MRLLNRSELKAIFLKSLPRANSKNAQDTAIVKLEQRILPNGEIVPEVKLRFMRISVKDGAGTIKWAWAYCGPIPYIDQEIILDENEKEEVIPAAETSRILI
jgi:hypothetical protein